MQGPIVGRERASLRVLPAALEVLSVHSQVSTLNGPSPLGGFADQQLSLVAVNVAESRLLDIKAREIAALSHVLSVSIVSGQYDIILEVLVDSNQGLIKFLTEDLSQVEGLKRTVTFLTLHSYNKWG